MLNFAEWSGFTLMNVVVLDGADGFNTLKRGFSRSQYFKTTHWIKQFFQSRMIPLNSVVQILPVDVANLITWITVSVEFRQNLAVAVGLVCYDHQGLIQTSIVHRFAQENPCGFGIPSRGQAEIYQLS